MQADLAAKADPVLMVQIVVSIPNSQPRGPKLILATLLLSITNSTPVVIRFTRSVIAIQHVPEVEQRPDLAHPHEPKVLPPWQVRNHLLV